MASDLESSVTVSHKVQPRQFESAEVSITVSNIRYDTTDAEVESLLDAADQIAYDKIVLRLRDRIAAIRAAREV